MPPPDSGASLSEAQIARIAEWIDAGAEFDEPWAFREIEVREPPVLTRASDWPKGEIDRFVLARLEREGLTPSDPADRRTWIRRVSLDLRGLPPTIDEVRAFLEDDSPIAREKVVDAFLADPSYGERRAQDWLDQARYADTSGYAADRYRSIWPFRDWVIDAYNHDQPFDEFTVAQLAGDLLPNATDDDRIATGFHRNAMQAKGNNPRIEEFRIKGIVDRVNTTARVWLGLTLECAECHDHKYDPISQKEYYEVFAYFNNVPHLGKAFGVHGPRMKIVSRETRAKIERLARERAMAKRRLDGYLATSDARPRREDEELAVEPGALVGRWFPKRDDAALSTYVLPRIVNLAAGDQPTGDLTITAWIRTRQEVADIVSKYDWRGRQRSFVFGIGGQREPKKRPGHLYAWVSEKPDPFSGVEIESSFSVNDGEWHHVALVFEAGRSIRLFVDGVEDSGALIIGKPPSRIAVSDRPLVIGGGFTNSKKPNAFAFEGDLRDVRVYRLAVEPSEDAKAVELRAVVRRIDELSKRLREDAVETAVMEELDKPRETYVLIRGNFENRGERVEPKLPGVLALGLERTPRDRLDLARWIVSRDNPLTARVTANRIWQQLLGRGLVSTGADFGSQGERPTHPELLDWLAESFVRQGWGGKSLTRDIVLSATYGQSSAASTVDYERDPDNRLLARSDRRRLPAEQLRDNALFVAGLLQRPIGGKSVFPPQPPGIWEERGQSDAGNSNLKWKNDAGPARFRRGLYTFWKRMSLYPGFLVFDAPTRERCVVERARTNSPIQALALLNDEVFVEAAQALARRVVSSRPASERLAYVFEVVLSRLPSQEESASFSRFFSAQLERFRRSPKLARALIGAKSEQIGGGQPSEHARLAAWTLVASVLLNLDETITRE